MSLFTGDRARHRIVACPIRARQRANGAGAVSAAAMCLLLALPWASPAQDHSHHSAPATPPAAEHGSHAGSASRAPATGHAAVDATGVAPDAAAMAPGVRADAAPNAHGDHSATGHAMPAMTAAEHAAMGHGAVRHGAAGHGAMEHGAMEQGAMEQGAMEQGAIEHGAAPGAQPPAAAVDGDVDVESGATLPLEPIPALTDADRAAAFGDLPGHAVHDQGIHWFALWDRLETWDADDGNGLAWEASSWIGTDLRRVWLRSGGEAIDGDLQAASAEVLVGRAVAPWWDAVVGVRHDFGDDPSQTFAAFGVIGLAPYKFEVQATAYLAGSGQAGIGVEAEYETLFTNRLILQSVVEAEAWGRDDAARGVASGLGKVEVGLRLRYEFTRRFAPYVGVVHERFHGGAADLRRAAGEPADDTRIVVGLRTWF